MKRALLSVSDKSGIVDLARFLLEHGYQLVSTGGTARELQDHAIAVTAISDYTGAPEILGGRVKTLHPKIFGGVLFDRTKSDHVRDISLLAIDAIDVVVVNLYPFEATVARDGVTLPEAIEQIDIGGPSLLRAAAKNHKDVIPLCEPALYDEFKAEVTGGAISNEFRRKTAVRVFEVTSAYDAAIAAFLSRVPRPTSRIEENPIGRWTGNGGRGTDLTLDLKKAQELRYGENPHQQAAFYIEREHQVGFEQLHGKELSYNNLLDLDAAYTLANSFSEPAAIVIKHTNPAGAAVAASPGEAVQKAIECDPVSAFGGIIGVNRQFDASCVDAIGTLFTEVIVAPGFAANALETLRKKKNLRLIRAGDLSQPFQIRSAVGGYLVQQTDQISSTGWNVVTRRTPGDAEAEALRFAWIVAAHVKSNAIVVARKGQIVGVGAGQMSRVDAAKIALMKAVLPVADTVAASDAFFPFRDGLDLLADAGVKAIIQPGGSVRDEEVIAAADERGIAMVFTAERHFRH